MSMTELPDHEDIKMVERGDLDHWQQQGWRVIGIVTEDRIIDTTQEVQCPGPGSSGGGCVHGTFVGNVCSQSNFMTTPMKVSTPLSVLTRDAHSLCATLHETQVELANDKVQLADNIRENMERVERIHELERDVSLAMRQRAALEADVAELREANADANTEKRLTAEENVKLRCHVHAEAMARIERVSEAMLHGDPVHPLAFCAYLDSLEPICANPEDYLELLRDWIDCRVIREKRDDEGNLMIEIMHPNKVRTALRALDARKRLAGAEEENAQAF